MWGSGCEVHALSLAMLQHCSCEMLKAAVAPTRVWDPASQEQDLCFHITWDTVILFVCFFNIEPYIFLSNLRSECDF